MRENNQEQIGLIKITEDSRPIFESLWNSESYENFSIFNDEQLKLEFLVQDMFLDHFFP